MHAFHVPNDLPYRYSFLYTFILLIIGAYSLINIKNIKIQLITIVYLLLITVLLFLTMNVWDGITPNMLFINMILLTIYFFIIRCQLFIKETKSIIIAGLILFSVVEVVVSINYNWNITQEIKELLF